MFDPVLLEVMRHRWRSIAEEACAAMVRTAYSPNIKDRRDCSAAVALPSGEIVAQAEVGTPLHLGILPAVIRAVLAEYPLETLEPGDAVITNLPYPEGPGHLPDVSMVSPVYVDGRPIAVAATTAHHIDLGGYAPGSMPLGVEEIYQEGLQIPPTPVFRLGQVDEVILRLIEQNARTRHEVRGDLLAQYAAGRTAERRVAELCAISSTELALEYAQHVLDHAERVMRDGIGRLADGVYSFDDFLDDDGFSDEPVRIAVDLTIAGEELLADFSRSSPQVRGPLNCRASAAASCLYYAAKAVIDPDLPTSAGAYRALKVKVLEGSVLQARFPAAVGNANILTDQRVVDALFGAFYQVAPERVCAACSGEMNLVNLGGIDPRTGEYFNYVETLAGGQGALHDADGGDAVHTHLTNTLNTPIEVIEQAYPLEVTEYALLPDTEGAGRFRGGCALVREIRSHADRLTVSIGADRRRFTPWGLENEHHAAGAMCYVIRLDGTRELLPTKVVTTLVRGERLRIETPGGGGWGDPHQRDRELLAAEVAEGLISPQRAASVYGLDQ
ncbi:hydantoinase B/oxoprolinase family protein [Aeoliella sp. ICT_H6.2]|uniref:Hydantoinase B/oxoprolinase family protein n=1 Tax=Aeoliella straminimaris TaxID=2954799 RepID=A0A9X2FAD5_9BACT|nr:hydantoinase B/oxoprolinase family protein [Aeoliella straminimaris]MCO6044889.1 hydantoinase B/oxoprolinase family protein [Aeoliella straminimaris]